jgi:hypothetical protein
VNETKALIEMDAFLAAFGHPCDEAVEAKFTGFVNHGSLELTPDASPTTIRFNIKRGFTGIRIRLAVRPFADRRPPDNLAVQQSNEDGMALIMRFKPGQSLSDGFGLGIKGRSGRCDRLVVDFGDGCNVVNDGAPDNDPLWRGADVAKAKPFLMVRKTQRGTTCPAQLSVYKKGSTWNFSGGRFASSPMLTVIKSTENNALA